MTLTETGLPANVEVERALVGAMLLGPESVAVARETVAAEDFYRPSHGLLFSAIVDLTDRDGATDATLVSEELRRRGHLDEVGGAGELLSIQLSGCSPSVAARHAAIVRDLAQHRQVLGLAAELRELASEGRRTAEELAAEVAARVQMLPKAKPAGRAVDGATFLERAEESVAAPWGRGDDVLWAPGQALMVTGPTGVGKTTLAGDLIRGRLGLCDAVLGFPVQDDGRRVLYLAMDRPVQAAESFARMVSIEDRDVLRDRLVVWPGPPPDDPVRNPTVLASLAEEHNAGTLIVDSLKDLSAKLTDDETGSRVNSAVQHCLAAGVEVLLLHHHRKRQQGAGAPRHLDDVYGSTWLTAGCGSVLCLWAEAGDPVVEMTHIKQPRNEVGPLTLLHDQATGAMSVMGSIDLYAIVRTSNGLTAGGAARALFSVETPTKNQVEKARRRLDNLARTGAVHKQDGGRDDHGRQQEARYFATTQEP